MIDLAARARALTSAPKGILAADESDASADRRLASYGIETGSSMRQKYRDLFLGTSGIHTYLSGVILFTETLGQKSSGGTAFPELLNSQDIMLGIKVDEGTEPFPESPEELITKGLIGLPERLAEYVKKYDTKFTKWRSVIRISGDHLPTSSALVENSKRLAQYARLVQEAGMVPIVEPEVLYEGEHSRVRSRDVIMQTLSTLVTALNDQAVDLGSVVIKSSMAMSGKDTGRIDAPEEVAHDTLDAFIASVPAEIPGIVFLSGGQTNDQATDNLAAIQKLAKERNVPWNLTFSYARALQDEALTIWAGKDENVEAARAAFLARLTKVSATYVP